MGFRRGRGSAALRAKVTALVVVVSLCFSGSVATNFKVGDSTGWTFSDYTTWASGKTFRVGDTLEFVYSNAHNVVEVTQSDYDSCSAANPTPYTDGDTKIELKTIGSKYFICSVAGHCSEGMKLAVDVLAAAAATPTSSPTPSTPSDTTNFKVGDNTGWTFSDYTSWASGKTFRVRDTLEFVYSDAHNVVEVTKSDYDSCSAGNATPYTDGDTKIELKTTGSKYFICSVPGHCSEGMKLAVDVLAAAAATPTSSPPPSTPSDTTNFKVGDSTGWTFSDYTSWASGKTFRVGDTLEFVYSNAHNVVEVTKSDYDSCSAGNTTPYTDGDTKIELKTTGSKYFICSVRGHCSEGMKLAVDVLAATTPSTPNSNNSTTPPPGSSSFVTLPPSLWTLSAILGLLSIFIRTL